jgi:predicted dehydrogenase
VTIKAAIVGTGFSAGAHVDALRRLPGVELAAVVGSSRERAQEAAARWSVPRGLGSLDELLADDEIRVVHDCTPNDLHAEVNLAVLAAGRHLLSEKPLGRDGEEARAQAVAAESGGVVAGVCFNYRHYPLVQQLRTYLGSGDYGAVHLVHGGYLQDWLLYETDWSWRLDEARNGPSRAVADIGSHWVDLVQHVLGDQVVEVCARLGTVHEERIEPPGGATTFSQGDGTGTRHAIGTEDFATILLRFASGLNGSLTVSQVSAGRKNRLHFEVDAAQAAFAWDQEESNRLWIGHRGEPNETLFRDPSLLDAPAAGLAHYPGGHEEGWPDALLNLLADFYAAVAAHETGAAYTPTFATFAEAAQVGAVVDAVLASSAGDSWTSLTAEEVV